MNANGLKKEKLKIGRLLRQIHEALTRPPPSLSRQSYLAKAPAVVWSNPVKASQTSLASQGVRLNCTHVAKNEQLITKSC
jgi:hypothetical protein